ncbi:MAG: hypothetical protein KF784_05655 [Fimbriimonadaceae bacterium]|nr:hypothetical protein [Fimbriimonadaceae bacterium]
MYLAGITENPSLPAQRYNALLAKYSSAGVLQWQATYNGPGSNYDNGTQVVIDSSDNPYLVGAAPHPVSGTDVFARKYSSGGVLQWTFSWDSGINVEDSPVTAAVGPGGTLYIGGERRTATGTDLFLIKLSSAGTLLWQIVFDSGLGDDTISALAVLSNGDVCVGGAMATGSSGEDALVAKVSSAGAVLWAAIYDSGNGRRECTTSLQIDATGNVYIAGTTWKPDLSGVLVSQTDMFTVKYNASGTQQWATVVDGGSDKAEICISMCLDSSNNVILLGNSYGGPPSSGGTGDDFLIAKVSSTGVLSWTTRYSGPVPGPDQPEAIMVSSAGFIYATGACWDLAFGTTFETESIVTVKLNGAGNILGVTKYQSAAGEGDHAVDILQATSGNLWVAGNSYNPATRLDIVLLNQAP